MPSMCSVGSWVHARHMASQTNPTLLSSNHDEIWQCLGGVHKCLTLLLNHRESFTTSQMNSLNSILKQINQTPCKHIKSTANTKYKMSRAPIFNIGVECITHITSFLTVSDIASSFISVNSTFAIIGLEEAKKLDCYYLNGHQLLIQHRNELNKYVNVIDLGFKSFLVQSRIYCDFTAANTFLKWSTATNIPSQHLSVWYYTARKNKTFRPNRQARLNWTERDTNPLRNDSRITEEMVVTHSIPTQPNAKKIRSMFDRIGDIVPRKRKFLLLDERRIATVPYGNKYKTDRSSRTMTKWLVAVKYFDIFSQKLYFVDWVYLIKQRTSVEDIARYVENTILRSDAFCFDHCKQYLMAMNGCCSAKEAERDKFIFYEEYDAFDGSIHKLEYGKLIDDDFYSGDIFVFQLNPNHKYFKNKQIPLTIHTTFDRYESYSGTHLNADDFIRAITKTKPDH